MLQSSIDVNRSCSVVNDHLLSSDIGLYGANSDGRGELERFIAAKYRQVHNAELKEYLPLLLAIRNEGHLVCAAGFRPGLYQPMFLEQYLDVPIEQNVAMLSKQPVDRCLLVEIGNFAVASNGYGPLVMTIMSAILAEAGYEWMIFTVTEQVERLIRRLGFKPHYLARADADQLVGDKSHWGEYYKNNPRVMAGNLKTATSVIAQNAFLSEMVIRHQSSITHVACLLRNYCQLRME